MYSNNNQELLENLDYFMEQNQLDKVLKLSEQVLQTDKNNGLALYYGGIVNRGVKPKSRNRYLAKHSQDTFLENFIGLLMKRVSRSY